MGIRFRILAVLLAATCAAGCGSASDDGGMVGFPDLAARRPRVGPSVVAALAAGPPCLADRVPRRADLDRAVARAAGRTRFRLYVGLPFVGERRFLGIRADDGSTALVPLADSMPVRQPTTQELVGSSTVRIVRDRLLVRERGGWTDVGGAAGTTLDVGRELLLHRDLVRVTGAVACPRPEFRGDVPIRGLRARAADHGDAQASALMGSVRQVRWAARLGAAGQLEVVEMHVRGPGHLTLWLQTGWRPEGQPGDGRASVRSIPWPLGARRDRGRMDPVRLLRLLAAAGG